MLNKELEGLQLLEALVLKLRATTKKNAKEALLEEALSNPRTRKRILWILRYVYDDFITFGLTSDRVLQMVTLTQCAGYDIPLRETLDKLAARKLTGHAAIGTWDRLAMEQPLNLRKLLSCILDKDLRIKVGVTTLNKVLKKLELKPVQVFKLALGESYKDFLARRKRPRTACPPVWDGTWWVSRKYDGVRGTIMHGERTCVLSRKGKELTCFQRVLELVQRAKSSGFVIDAEMALRRADKQDDFQGLMKQLKRKDHTILSPRVYVLDVLTEAEFVHGSSTVTWSERRKRIKPLLDEIDPHREVFAIAKQVRVTSKAVFNKWRKRARRLNWEGLILRKDACYVGDRSWDILKVKDFIDAEVRITSIGSGDFAVSENGREEVITTMTQAYFEWKGNKRAKVGSGWSLDERKAFHANPSKIIGKVVTIRFFEETMNSKTGLPAPRFPTLQIIHGNEREV